MTAKLSVLALFVAALMGTTLAAPPPPVAAKKTNKDNILGTWELVKTSSGVPMGYKMHLIFTKDKMAVDHVSGTEKTNVYEAKYKIEGEKEDKLPYESTTEGVDKKETLKITKLTETELTLEDDDGIVEEFKRVKEEKKVEKKEEKKPPVIKE